MNLIVSLILSQALSGQIVQQGYSSTGTKNWNVNCVNCTNLVIADGGYLGTVGQAQGRDGGPWEVYVVNPSGGGGGGSLTLDGGFIGIVAIDGGSIAVNNFPAAFTVDIRDAGSLSVGGTVAVSNFPTAFTVDLRDAGTLNVGGAVTQGLGYDGGWNWGVWVANPVAPWAPDGGPLGSVVVSNAVTVDLRDAGTLSMSGSVSQGPGQDGGAWAVSVLSANVVDANNSTTTPLAAGATFTGTATDCLAFSQVAVTAYSNVASATLGFQVQFSTDGVNWNTAQTHTVNAGALFPIQYSIVSRYMRVIYTNGGSAQSTFRLQTLLKPIPANGTVTTLGDTPTVDDDALITQSLLFGETTGGGGGYRTVKVTPSGALNVAATQDTSPWVVSGSGLFGVNIVDGGVVNVGNWPSSFTVDVRDAGAVAVSNFPATQSVTQGTSPWVVSGSGLFGVNVVDGGTVNVGNFPTAFTVDVRDAGAVAVSNFPTAFTVDVRDAGTVAVSNFPTSQTVDIRDGGVTLLNPPGIASPWIFSGGTTSAPQAGATNYGAVTREAWKSVSNPVNTAVTCSTIVAAIPASPLSGRTTLTLYNNGQVNVYIGGSGVTSANGMLLPPGASFTDNVVNSTYYCITASSSADVRVLEN